MAEYLHYDCRTDDYFDAAGPDDNYATHVAWSLDDLPELAADIHAIVLRGVVHGTLGRFIDAAIIDCRRGTAPRADHGNPDA